MDFEPIALKHKALFDEIFALDGSRNSSLSFGNVFLWSDSCERSIARLHDRLLVEFQCRKAPFFGFPIGRGELAGAVDALRERAASRGRPFVLHGITQEEKGALDAAFPGRFDFTLSRDDSDYIYPIDAIASLAGKKLHAKRNYCNRFEAGFRWEWRELSPALFGDCISLLDRWERERAGDGAEHTAIRRMFEYWDTLGMEGGVLYADGEPVGFTAAELLTADTADVHFEKALSGVPGAYPMVARELARQLKAAHPALLYLNREEDMGLPQLRKAKEEWFPLYMLEKFTASWRDTP